jgi:hypothetical protein
MFMLKEAMGDQLPHDWPDMLPDVQRWSDIVWILWEEMAGSDAGKLKYIVSQYIRSPIFAPATLETKKIIFSK